MRKLGLDQQQRRELGDWIVSAFQQYASLASGVSFYVLPEEQDESESSSRICRWGEDLRRVIVEAVQLDTFGELPKASEELYQLKNSGFPHLDLVELLIFCTSGFDFTARCSFRQFGISNDLIASLRKNAERMALELYRLNHLPMGSLSDYIRDLHLGGRDGKRIRRLMRVLPNALEYLALFLDDFSLEAVTLPKQEDEEFLEMAPLAYFYLLLQRHGHGFPTLSHLLMFMRSIRSLPGELTEKRAGVSGYEDRARDPLSEGALQRTLHRFFSAHPKKKAELRNDVDLYLAPEFHEHRAAGETLLTCLPELFQSAQEQAGKRACLPSGHQECGYEDSPSGSQ